MGAVGECRYRGKVCGCSGCVGEVGVILMAVGEAGVRSYVPIRAGLLPKIALGISNYSRKELH